MLAGNERGGAGQERRLSASRQRDWSRRVASAGKKGRRDEQNSGRRYRRHAREVADGRRRAAAIRLRREDAAGRVCREAQRDNARLELRQYLNRFSVRSPRRKSREGTETSWPGLGRLRFREIVRQTDPRYQRRRDAGARKLSRRTDAFSWPWHRTRFGVRARKRIVRTRARRPSLS